MQGLIEDALPPSCYIRAPHAKHQIAPRLPLPAWQEAVGGLIVRLQQRLDERSQDVAGVSDSREEQRVEMMRHWLTYWHKAPRTALVTDAEGRSVSVIAGFDCYLHENCDVVWHENTNLISRRILCCTPHLQRLSLSIDLFHYNMLAVSASISLVPNLRKLTVNLWDSDETTTQATQDSILPFDEALDALPQLGDFCYTGIQVGIADLLRVAAHSTLETIIIECEHNVDRADAEWLGHSFIFNFALAGDKGSASHNESEEADAEEEDEGKAEATRNEEDLKADAEAIAADQRLATALTRTQPTLLSVQTRLALVEQVQRRINRHSLVAEDAWSISLLHQYRRQARLIRSTLEQQYKQLQSAADEADYPSSLPRAKRARW